MIRIYIRLQLWVIRRSSVPLLQLLSSDPFLLIRTRDKTFYYRYSKRL